jgi:ATP-dependent Clp protease adapter protein ClpS/tetratricopeptide (TPR) repeat protein
MPDINASFLPEKPDLVQERKRAKDLLRALRSGDDNAIARLRSHHPRFAELTPNALRATDVKLNDAQWVIAREYGFPSWQSLKAHIEQVSGRAGTAPHSVLIWNDDATPMEFVVHLLQVVFLKTTDNARQIMLDTHNHGVGVCAVYDRLDEAEAKIVQARDLARKHGHPLELTFAFGDAAKKGKPTRPLENDLGMARARLVRVDETDMHVELIDGRTLSVPLTWFPKLLSATSDQRRQYEFGDEGRVLSWNDLGLLISVSGLLVGPEGQTTVGPASNPPSSTARLEEAVAACRVTLGQKSRVLAPREWARAQYDLGNALIALGMREADTARLEEAVAAYHAALEEYNREHTPLEWANARCNLGHALIGIDGYGSGTARLEEAVTAYRAALMEGPRLPLSQWANTQDNLGNALFTLGTREGGTARLKEAIATYNEVLTDTMRERLPFQWAISAGNQGVSFRLLAERLSDGCAAETGVAQITIALEILRDGDHQPFAAYYEEQLSKARALFDRLSRR